MKTVRRGVFETNSSSTHSITICTKKEYEDWRCAKVLLDDRWNAKKQFITREEAIQKLQNVERYDYLKDTNWEDEDVVNEILKEKEIYSFSSYPDDDYETFYEEYTSPNGDEIVTFGYYGNDY